MGRQLNEMIDEMRCQMQAAQARGDERARNAADTLILDGFQNGFEAGNHTFAWLAYHFCTKAKTPIPAWVSDYLAHAAAGVLDLVRRPPARDVGAALASALRLQTERGITGALTAAKHADEASELLRVYQMFRFAGFDHQTAYKKLAEASARPGMAFSERTIRRRLDRHYPGWRDLAFEPPSLDAEP
jgi:hypothetical protein